MITLIISFSLWAASTDAKGSACTQTSPALPPEARPAVEKAFLLAEDIASRKDSFSAPSDEYLAIHSAAEQVLRLAVEAPLHRYKVCLSASNGKPCWAFFVDAEKQGASVAEILNESVACLDQASAATSLLNQIRLQYSERLAETSAEALAGLEERYLERNSAASSSDRPTLCSAIQLRLGQLSVQAALKKRLRMESAEEEQLSLSLSRLKESLCPSKP